MSIWALCMLLPWRQMRTRVCIAVAVFAILAASPAVAEPPSGQGEQIALERQLQVAIAIDRLLRLGRAEKDPAAIMEAARLSTKYEVGVAKDEVDVARPTELAKQWLGEAQLMAEAAHDIELLRRIRQLIAEADKGITPYAIVRIFDLGPQSRARLTAMAEAGEPTIIGATSDGSLRMSLEVQGSRGDVPECRSSGNVALVCRLEIDNQQELTISLRNRSRYSGTAYVISN